VRCLKTKQFVEPWLYIDHNKLMTMTTAITMNKPIHTHSDALR